MQYQRFKIPVLGLLVMVLGGLFASQAGWTQSGGPGQGPAVRNVGLSRVQDTTLLTILLDREARPRITPREGAEPQLVVEFPQARALHLPATLPGDEILVRQVRIQTTPQGGVQIILELFPNRAYNYWGKPWGVGRTNFLVGLIPEIQQPYKGRMAPEMPAAPPAAPAAPPAPRLKERGEKGYHPAPAPTTAPAPPPRAEAPGAPPSAEPPGEAPEPSRDDYGYKEEAGAVKGAGNFAELQRLIPRAASLFQSLGADGWIISEVKDYDRPGQRQTRSFRITNPRYPELVIKVAHLAGGPSLGPDINFVILSTENVRGQDAERYRELRKYSFAEIRRKYEDIGDFFDEALRPLRLNLRKQTQSLTLSHAALFQRFLQRACPQKPQLAEQFLARVKEKPNIRFEGVQYTLSEDPLVMLSLVDFLYVKVFFLGAG